MTIEQEQAIENLREIFYFDIEDSVQIINFMTNVKYWQVEEILKALPLIESLGQSVKLAEIEAEFHKELSSVLRERIDKALDVLNETKYGGEAIKILKGNNNEK